LNKGFMFSFTCSQRRENLLTCLLISFFHYQKNLKFNINLHQLKCKNWMSTNNEIWIRKYLSSRFVNFIQSENIWDVFLQGPKFVVKWKVLISNKPRSSTKIWGNFVLKKSWKHEILLSLSGQWFHVSKYWSIC